MHIPSLLTDGLRRPPWRNPQRSSGMPAHRRLGRRDSIILSVHPHNDRGTARAKHVARAQALVRAIRPERAVVDRPSTSPVSLGGKKEGCP